MVEATPNALIAVKICPICSAPISKYKGTKATGNSVVSCNYFICSNHPRFKYCNSVHVIKPPNNSRISDKLKPLNQNSIETVSTSEIKNIIINAINNKSLVTIKYKSASGDAKTRTIKPYKIDGIYVKAFCYLAKEDRTFRIDRILTAR